MIFSAQKITTGMLAAKMTLWTLSKVIYDQKRDAGITRLKQSEEQGGGEDKTEAVAL